MAECLICGAKEVMKLREETCSWYVCCEAAYRIIRQMFDQVNLYAEKYISVKPKELEHGRHRGNDTGLHELADQNE